jgi:cell filamentation protein
MDHPYCYPGTDVLRNKEDIRDGEELERFERVASARRLETLPHDLAITVDGFREIHRYMLQDVYDWAGEYRGVDTGRTGPFCLARFISHNMDARFAAINAENNLRGLAQREFAERAAEHMCELNAIHCFLDGNGRALRAFLQLLAAQAGHEIDLARIEPTAWNAAAIAGYHLPAHSWSAGETREFVAEGTVATSMIPAKLVASSRSGKGGKPCEHSQLHPMRSWRWRHAVRRWLKIRRRKRRPGN